VKKDDFFFFKRGLTLVSTICLELLPFSNEKRNFPLPFIYIFRLQVVSLATEEKKLNNTVLRIPNLEFTFY